MSRFVSVTKEEVFNVCSASCCVGKSIQHAHGQCLPNARFALCSSFGPSKACFVLYATVAAPARAHSNRNSDDPRFESGSWRRPFAATRDELCNPGSEARVSGAWAAGLLKEWKAKPFYCLEVLQNRNTTRTNNNALIVHDDYYNDHDTYGLLTALGIALTILSVCCCFKRAKLYYYRVKPLWRRLRFDVYLLLVRTSQVVGRTQLVREIEEKERWANNLCL